MSEAPTAAGDGQILILAECADGSRAWVACAPTGSRCCPMDYEISLTADRIALSPELSAGDWDLPNAWHWLDSDGHPMLPVTVLGWIPAPGVMP